MVAALALFSIYSWTLPISSEFFKMSWFMKALTGGSILCGLAFYIIVVVLSVKSGKENKKYYYDILYAFPLLVLETLNVLAIFDYKIWGHKSMLAGLSLVIIMFVELFASIRTIFKKSFGQENTPVTLLALTIISFVLAAVNESAGNMAPANLCYKVCFGLAFLVAIALYTHQFIYKTKNSESIVSTIIGIIFWGATITMTFPYYVKWCGLSETAFETFVSVYAAVLGGGITLAGVAWTIKDTHDKSKEDIKRIENEQKEEERKRNIPYIKSVLNVLCDENEIVTIKNKYDYNNPEHRTAFTDNNVYSIQIGEFGVKNISDTNIIFYGICINDEYYRFEGFVLEKNKNCKITINNSNWITSPKQLSSIKLIVRDMIGNNYSILCKFSLNRNVSPESGDEITDDGINYKIHTRSYVVSKVSLPEYFEKE